MTHSVPPVPPAQATLSSAQPVPAEVKSLPPTLLNVTQATTVRGEVSSVDRDGTVRVQTPQGEAQLKIDPPPQRGQVIELRLTPPPKQTPLPNQIQPTPQGQSTPAQQSVPTNNPAISGQTGAQSGAQTTAPTVNTAQTGTPPAISGQTPANPHLPNVTVKFGVIHNAPPSGANPSQASGTQAQTTSLGNLKAFSEGPARLLQTASAAVKTLLSPSSSLTLTTTGVSTAAGNASSPLTTIQNAPQSLQTRPLEIGATLRLLSPANPLTQPLNSTATLTANATGLNNTPSSRPPILTTMSTINNPLSSLANSSAQTTATSTPHIDVKVLGIQSTTPQGSPITTQAPLPATGNSFIAQVLGFTPQSLPVLSAALTPGQSAQTMVLQFPVNNLAVGDLVQLSPTSQLMPQATATKTMTTTLMSHLAPSHQTGNAPNAAQPQGTLTAPQAHTPVFTGFAGDWPVLEDALDSLLQALPADQANNLRQLIPQPMAGGQRLDAPAMLFIAALRNGDITNWLGERGTQQLQSLGKSETLSQLLRDMASMGARLNDPAPIPTAGGDWRSVSLPMLFGADLQRMQLFVQDHGADKDQTDTDGMKKDWIRFVMNADLSNIGALQLDGIHSETRNSLDLLIRSNNEIGPDMRKTMRQRYAGLMGGMDMAGALDFKTEPDYESWMQF